MNECLTCEYGHTWTRTAVRGRKPRICPEHRSIQLPSASPQEGSQGLSEVPVPPLVKAREVKAERAIKRSNEIDAQVRTILAHEGVNPELKRKLQYVEKQFDREREPGDIIFLQKIRKDLIREARIT